MKSLVLIVAVVAACVTLIVCNAERAQSTSSRSNLQEWRAYKQKYGKVYESPEEDARRFALFMQSKAKLAALRGVETHKRGLNHLSDWSRDEFMQLNGVKLPASDNHELLMAHFSNSQDDEKFLQAILDDDSKPVPDEVDWRKVPNRVSAVKNQEHCSSCWAFATTGLLEGQELLRSTGSNNKKNVSLITLSEQDLVDCSESNYKCSGGLMVPALRDIAKMGGIESEQAYPYTAAEGRCRFSANKSVMSDAGATVLPQFDEAKLKTVVARYGPVSVAIDASDLSDYASGVYQGERCGHTVNHAVLIVGYGTDPKHGGDYWIVKNSWSDSWGEQGYFRLTRNKNTCNVGYYAVIATF